MNNKSTTIHLFLYSIKYANREEFNNNLSELNIKRIIKKHQFVVMKNNAAISTQDFDTFGEGVAWATKKLFALLFSFKK